MKNSSTLDMFFEDATEKPLWTDKHIAILQKSWAKLTPAHKLYEYNLRHSNVILSSRSVAELVFIASANIPNLSNWAKKCLKSKT